MIKDRVLKTIYESMSAKGIEVSDELQDNGEVHTEKERMDKKIASTPAFKVLCLLLFAKFNVDRTPVVEALLAGKPVRGEITVEDVGGANANVGASLDYVANALYQQYKAIAAREQVDIYNVIKVGVLGGTDEKPRPGDFGEAVVRAPRARKPAATLDDLGYARATTAKRKPPARPRSRVSVKALPAPEPEPEPESLRLVGLDGGPLEYDTPVEFEDA
jgi:hypothetical protein